MHPRTRRTGAPASVLVCLGLLLVLGGCGGGSAAPTGPKTARPTPISQLNTSALRLARVDFCPLVPSDAVRDALAGSGAQTRRSWRNGDPTRVDTGVTDVVHEFGCLWSRPGHVASAWIFARPVTRAVAQAVIDKTSRRKGCTSPPGPSFGSPGQRQSCTLPDGSRRVRVSGLFGEDWLTCQVSGPAGETETAVGQRADAWCVQVANATNTAR